MIDTASRLAVFKCRDPATMAFRVDAKVLVTRPCACFEIVLLNVEVVLRVQSAHGPDSTALMGTWYLLEAPFRATDPVPQLLLLGADDTGFDRDQHPVIA